jgi:hypothetical protein
MLRHTPLGIARFDRTARLLYPSRLRNRHPLVTGAQVFRRQMQKELRRDFGRVPDDAPI